MDFVLNFLNSKMGSFKGSTKVRQEGPQILSMGAMFRFHTRGMDKNRFGTVISSYFEGFQWHGKNLTFRFMAVTLNNVLMFEIFYVKNNISTL